MAGAYKIVGYVGALFSIIAPPGPSLLLHGAAPGTELDRQPAEDRLLALPGPRSSLVELCSFRPIKTNKFPTQQL